MLVRRVNNVDPDRTASSEVHSDLDQHCLSYLGL